MPKNGHFQRLVRFFVASHFKALIQPTLQARADSDGVGGRVLNYIDQACRSFEKVSMPLAAEAFQMETSTLRRRLALEDTKFSEILQNYRRKESMRLPTHSPSPPKLPAGMKGAIPACGFALCGRLVCCPVVISCCAGNLATR